MNPNFSRTVTDAFPFPFNLSHPSRVPYLLIVLWALSMISIPILRWTLGDEVLTWGVNLTVILLAAGVVMLLWQQWGAQQALRVSALVMAGSWAVEWFGSTTGFPFGSYGYTPALQPQAGHVPLLIPLAWLMMLPAAWAVAYAITGSGRGWRFVTVSALALTAWDLFLDPQMVAWGYWVWAEPGGYFGIPWGNFAGWALSAALLTLLAQPPAPPRGPLLVIYTVTWLLQAIGLFFFWGLAGPALSGFIVMGVFVWLAWRRTWVR